MRPTATKTLLLTSLAMTAFAANSLLCRMALGDGAIDAASFTGLRLASGALVLWLLLLQRTGEARLGPNPKAAIFLFAPADLVRSRSLVGRAGLPGKEFLWGI